MALSLAGPIRGASAIRVMNEIGPVKRIPSVRSQSAHHRLSTYRGAFKLETFIALFSLTENRSSISEFERQNVAQVVVDYQRRACPVRFATTSAACRPV
jgi:hypothetical protein